MTRIVYFAGRVVGLLVQPFVDGVLDGAFGTPDQDERIPFPTAAEARRDANDARAIHARMEAA